MTVDKQTVFSKDLASKKMTIVREFTAPLKRVWAAWTEKDLLDVWWAPKPWKAETKSMNFKEGGNWHYCMIGPDGTKVWARLDYKSIGLYEHFHAEDSFCDERGIINTTFSSGIWKTLFQSSLIGTQVIVEISFQSEAAMEKMLEMGFEAGFASAHDNLDELLENDSLKN